MKYCNKCGTKLLDGAAFCGECGNAVKTAAAPPAPKPKKKRGKFIGGIALLIILACTAVYLSGQGDNGAVANIAADTERAEETAANEADVKESTTATTAVEGSTVEESVVKESVVEDLSVYEAYIDSAEYYDGYLINYYLEDLNSDGKSELIKVSLNTNSELLGDYPGEGGFYSVYTYTDDGEIVSLFGTSSSVSSGSYEDAIPTIVNDKWIKSGYYFSGGSTQETTEYRGWDGSSVIYMASVTSRMWSGPEITDYMENTNFYAGEVDLAEYTRNSGAYSYNFNYAVEESEYNDFVAQHMGNIVSEREPVLWKELYRYNTTEIAEILVDYYNETLVASGDDGNYVIFMGEGFIEMSTEYIYLLRYQAGPSTTNEYTMANVLAGEIIVTKNTGEVECFGETWNIYD